MTANEVGRLMKALAVEYADFAVTPERVALWANSLAGLSYADGKTAVLRCLLERKFAPALSEVVDIILEHLLALPTPEEAWAEVEHVADQWGSDLQMYRLIDTPEGERLEVRDFPGWSSRAVEAAVAAVGWGRICAGDEPRGFIQRDLTRVYAAYRARATEYARLGSVAALPPLPQVNGPVAVIRQCVAELLHRHGDGRAVEPTPIGPAVLAGEPDDVPF